MAEIYEILEPDGHKAFAEEIFRKTKEYVDSTETDTKVTQTQDDSTNGNFEVLLAGSTSTTTATEGAKKSSSLMLNPVKASMSVGVDSIASGFFSYAQGNNVVASGESSHAQGDNTIANNFAQSVFGAYNIEDTTPIGESGLLEIVGNGNVGERSNARTLDWNGNEVLSGKLTVGTAPTNNMDVTTKLYVDNKQIELTQAQYDALTPEEKNNGTTYFITDAPGGGGNVDDVYVNGVSVLDSNKIAQIDLTGKLDKTGDTMTGQLVMQGTDIRLETPNSSSNDSSDIVWYYGNGQEKARLWTNEAYTAESGLNFRMYKEDGTSLFSGTIPLRDTTYNFSGTIFYSGNSNTAEHNCNDAIKNGNYYYTSNGPATSIGASTSDGALYVQSYSDTWVAQIAQDYRNGRLFVRGKNNGTWQSWRQVADSGNVGTGDSNGQVKIAGTNVSVKGLGSAAYLTAATTATANTVAERQGNGYLYATFYNTSCPAQNPSSFTSYPAFIDDDGWLRKSDAANFRTLLGLGSLATLSSLSSKIIVGEVVADNVSIAANGSAQTPNVSTTKSGWTALTVLSVNLANASSGGTLYSWCSVYSLNMNASKQVNAQIRNHYTGGAAKIKAIFRILYVS